MSDNQLVNPEALQGGEGELPRNDLGELTIGEDITVVGLDFEAGRTVREIRQEIDELLIEYGKDIDLARDRIGLIIEAQNLYFDGRVSKGLDDATAREAELLIAGLRLPKGGRDEPEEIEIVIPAQLKKLLDDASEKLTEIATMTAEAKLDISQNDKLKDLLDQQELEDGFETDIESPLSWSQENWQQVASMTPEEQEYFAGKKKQSNASKRVWARRANEMLHDAMLEQALQEAIGRWDDLNEIEEKAGVKMPTSNDLDRDTLEALDFAIKERQSVVANQQANNRPLTQALQEAEDRLKYLEEIGVKMPTYTYTEWKAMEVLAAQAEQANAMLKEQARQEAISKGLYPDTVTIGNYNYPEWVDMKALLSAEAREANEMLYQSMIKEARQKEADLGYKPNTLLVKKRNYTYEEWIAMKALHTAIKERRSNAAKRGWVRRRANKSA